MSNTETKSFNEKATSKSFLETRIKMNRNSLKDFDEWSINIMPKLPLNTNILDLGCGIGKQVLSFSQFMSKNTKYFALDKSNDNLQILKNNYKSLPYLTLINDEFENFPKYIPEEYEKFDIIYSFYSLYYSNNIGKLFSLIYKHLKNSGFLWIVMPFTGTNNEIFTFIEKFYKINKKVKYSVDEFYKDVILLAEKNGFNNCKINTLYNKIIFKNENDLLNYIINTTFYNDTYKNDISNEVKQIFKKESIFHLSKNILSLIFEK